MNPAGREGMGVLAIKKGELKEEERAPKVKIKTRIFRAVPLKNAIAESIFKVAAARRSNIEASDNGSGGGLDSCGQRLSEHDCAEESGED